MPFRPWRRLAQLARASHGRKVKRKRRGAVIANRSNLDDAFSSGCVRRERSAARSLRKGSAGRTCAGDERMEGEKKRARGGSLFEPLAMSIIKLEKGREGKKKRGRNFLTPMETCTSWNKRTGGRERRGRGRRARVRASLYRHSLRIYGTKGMERGGKKKS